MTLPVIPDVPQGNPAISDPTTPSQKEVVNLDGSQLYSPVDGKKATYAASVQGLAVAASATDVFEIKGSGTKTIRVNRVRVSGIKTTAGADVDIVTLIRSTANTAGTSTAPTAVPYDSTSAARSEE